MHRIICLALSLGVFALKAQTQGEVVPKRIVGLVYPWFPRVAGIEGAVELLLKISTDGTVQSVVVSSGPPPLAMAASESASKWLFDTSKRPREFKMVFLFSFLKGLCDHDSRCPLEFEVELPNRVIVRAQRIKAMVKLRHPNQELIGYWVHDCGTYRTYGLVAGRWRMEDPVSGPILSGTA